MKKHPTDKDITMRIVDSAYLDQCWKDAEKIYGKIATEKLRSVAPADPFLLYDIAEYSYKTEGKKQSEIKSILADYSHDDWAYDMVRFARMINKIKKLYKKDILKGNNTFTSNI